MRPAITEAAFQDRTIQHARILGWRVAHFRPARTSKGWRTPMIGDPGWPDLVLVRSPRIVFAELKRDRSSRSKPSPDQVIWIDQLAGVRDAIEAACAGAGPFFEVAIWTPDDFDLICSVLR